MFKTGQDNMRMEPTPERVFAMGRFLLSGNYSREELYQELCLGAVFGDGSRDVFNLSINVIQELGIVTDNEGIYQITEGNSTVFDSIDNFRRYSAKTALSRIDTLFLKTTSLYLKLADEVLKCKGWEGLANLLTNNTVFVTDNDILGWRFWVSFFGLGYLHTNTIIPNTYNRFKDVLLDQDAFEYNEPIEISKFMVWLEARCPEIKESRMDNSLGLAVSSGLRTLNISGDVELISQPDAKKWQLYMMESETINDVSHIRLLR